MQQMALIGFSPTTLRGSVIRERERWHVFLVIRTHISRVAPDWDLWRTLYLLNYGAAVTYKSWSEPDGNMSEVSLMKLATSMMLQSQCHGLSSRMTTGMLTTSSPLAGSSGSTSLVVIKFLRVSLEMVCRLLCERSSVLSFGNEVKLLIENSEMLFQLDSNRGCFKMTPCSRVGRTRVGRDYSVLY